MKKLLIGTTNQGKLREIKSALSGTQIELITLEKEGNTLLEVEETCATIPGNAFLKAQTIQKRTLIPTLAEDTGLCVVALDGFPGVKSARAFGKGLTDEEKVKGLLQLMEGEHNRKAYFYTFCVVALDGETTLSGEGQAWGTITTEPRGSNGFGYDTIFIPDGETKTFAEMTLKEKEKFSQRQKAVEMVLKSL